MRILIATIFLLAGCGTMEGDVNVDGDSPSTQEEESIVEKNGVDKPDDTIQSDVDEPTFKNYDYIQIGMTMDMIINIVGRPHQIKTTQSRIIWLWDEGRVDHDICSDGSPWRNECYLVFDKTTKRVYDQKKMSTEYLDIYDNW